DEALPLLERVLTLDNSKTWAHLRRGLLSLQLNNTSMSLKTLKINDNRLELENFFNFCSASWSALGDANFHSNNIRTALTCYHKASALEKQTLYSLTREGYSLTLLGRYDEAVRLFDNVIEQAPKYLLARKGKGEAYMLLANVNLGRYKDHLAVVNTQKALTCFHDALCLQPEYACLWKKYGDGCMLLHIVKNELVHILLPPLTRKLTELTTDTDGCIHLNKIDLLERAQKCYMQAIRLCPRSPLYWSCLAHCLYIQYRLKLDDQILLTSFNYMKIAVSLRTNDYRLWNSLGVIAAHPHLHTPGFAQHCFFKSIQLQRSSCAYTNLGFLYYCHDNIQAANQAFSTAQQLDPQDSIAWTGQALIAEKIDPSEKTDLYRHCVELSNHSQGLYGYGKSIADLLIKPDEKSSDTYRYSIEYMNGNHKGAEALVKFLQRYTDDGSAHQCLAVILEFNQLFISAAKAYHSAHTHCSTIPKLSNTLRNDYARAQCRSGDAKSALDTFVQKEAPTTLLDLLWISLSYVKIGQRIEAIALLKRTVDLSETSNKDRSIILAFIGLLQITLDQKAALASLFKSYSTKPACSSTVTTLCAVGMSANDIRITLAALKEMPKLTDSTYTMEIHLLQCMALIFTNKAYEAHIYSMTGIRAYPYLSWAWALGLLARIQYGLQNGLHQIIETICSTFTRLNERIAIIIANALIRSQANQQQSKRIFQSLIMQYPAQKQLRICFSEYLQSYDKPLAQAVLLNDLVY
ncbi:unnamed protein product, partial [Didymodactylos carnosus]